MSGTVGWPRLHLRRTTSTNDRARELALAGAPHGMLITASEQSAGRGRQGRSWSAPPSRTLLCSLIVRDPPPLLPLIAGVAVAELAGPQARLKWPNDVLLCGRKLAGVLVEGRPQEHWAVVGIGVNVATVEEDFPSELRERVASLGRGPEALEPTLTALLGLLERWLAASTEEVLDAIRRRDALLGQRVRWEGGHGRASGIDGEGRLIIVSGDHRLALEAGEVHLEQ